jgi:putative endonuclease
MGGWVYIMTNAPHRTLYIGVTADLAARVYQHRTGKGSEFCRKHGLTRLVYVESYDLIVDAIAREKAMKKWKRAWKLRLICQANPHWNDLFEHINDLR